jgi:hypothetical protein
VLDAAAFQKIVTTGQTVELVNYAVYFCKWLNKCCNKYREDFTDIGIVGHALERMLYKAFPMEQDEDDWTLEEGDENSSSSSDSESGEQRDSVLSGTQEVSRRPSNSNGRASIGPVLGRPAGSLLASPSLFGQMSSFFTGNKRQTLPKRRLSQERRSSQEHKDGFLQRVAMGKSQTLDKKRGSTRTNHSNGGKIFQKRGSTSSKAIRQEKPSMAASIFGMFGRSNAKTAEGVGSPGSSVGIAVFADCGSAGSNRSGRQSARNT